MKPDRLLEEAFQNTTLFTQSAVAVLSCSSLKCHLNEAISRKRAEAVSIAKLLSVNGNGAARGEGCAGPKKFRFNRTALCDTDFFFCGHETPEMSETASPRSSVVRDQSNEVPSDSLARQHFIAKTFKPNSSDRYCTELEWIFISEVQDSATLKLISMIFRKRLHIIST